jgi:hypothetical protein
MAIEIEQTHEIYDASDADRGACHVCEPQLLRLSTGTLVLSHRIGTGRASDDGTSQLLTSTDDGRTWALLGTPFESSRPVGWDVRRASLTELASGAILAALLAIDKSLGLPLYNPATEGCLPIHNLYSRSEDCGVSWSLPWPLGPIAPPQISAQALLTLPTGEVLCTFERFKMYNDPGPWRYEAGCMRSADGGTTWNGLTTAAASDKEGDPDDTMWWDPRIARLNDGRLVQFYYAYRHRTGVEGATHVAWSNDEGRSWTPPAPTSLYGQAAYPIPLKRGGLVVFQQRRTEPQTMVACFSSDGKTFHARDETVVYQHLDASAPSADGSLDPVSYLGSMDRFTFGHPTGVELEPDRILVAWYAGGLVRTAVKGATLRLARS